MNCRGFQLGIEDYLDTHPNSGPSGLPAALSEHAARCQRCAHDLDVAWRSRRLLATLHSTPAEAPAELSPFFFTRLRQGIEARQAPTNGWYRPNWRELAAVTLLFILTLGGFLYNLHRASAPNMDEAFALDAPHVHPFHPNADHVRAQKSDVLVSLLRP